MVGKQVAGSDRYSMRAGSSKFLIRRALTDLLEEGQPAARRVGSLEKFEQWRVLVLLAGPGFGDTVDNWKVVQRWEARRLTISHAHGQ